MKKIIMIISLAILFETGVLLYPLQVFAADNGVVLDGYYDDWADKPQVELKYDWMNPGQVHTVKWYSDDKYLYLNIKMGTRGGQSLNYYIIYFYVNDGQQKQLHFSPDDPSYGRVSIIDVNGQYKRISNDGYVTRGSNSDGKTSDQAEFRIPLSEFQSEGKNQMFNLRLEFPNLGYQSVIIHTGSTKPYLGIAICSLSIIPGYFIFHKKRKTA